MTADDSTPSAGQDSTDVQLTEDDLDLLDNYLQRMREGHLTVASNIGSIQTLLSRKRRDD
jgi:hypothetical protein